MTDFILVVILAVMIGSAVVYIVNAKKKGVRCIGCPAGGECARKCSGNCGGGCNCSDEGNSCSCGGHTDEK